MRYSPHHTRFEELWTVFLEGVEKGLDFFRVFAAEAFAHSNSNINGNVDYDPSKVMTERHADSLLGHTHDATIELIMDWLDGRCIKLSVSMTNATSFIVRSSLGQGGYTQRDCRRMQLINNCYLPLRNQIGEKC